MIRLRLATTLAALATLLAAGPVIAFAGPGDGPQANRRQAADGARRGPREGMRRGRHAHRMQHRMNHRAMRFGRLLRSLELSDAQRALIADASALAAPVRQDLHAKIRTILEDARTAARTTPRTPGQPGTTRAAVREQVKAAVTAARASLEVPARRFLDTLTPDQRAKLEAKAKAHGKTFDEQRLLKAFEGMLLAPRQGMHRHGMRAGMERDGMRGEGMRREGMRRPGMPRRPR